MLSKTKSTPLIDFGKHSQNSVQTNQSFNKIYMYYRQLVDATPLFFITGLPCLNQGDAKKPMVWG